jgi:hypothetical protein
MTANQKVELIKSIANQGGRLNLQGNIDVRPYQQLENLVWVTVTALSMQDNLIEITEDGKAVARKL